MSAAPLPLRCKTRYGQQMVENLTTETTVADFRAVLSGLSDIGYSRLRVLSGFPPQPLDLSDEAARLSTLGLRPRDTVIIEELKYEVIENDKPHKKAVEAATAAEARHNQASNGQSLLQSTNDNAKRQMMDLLPEGMLMRQTVPSDNSCLFTSVYYCITGGHMDHKVAATMRKIIADHVTKDPDTYNEGFLGQGNREYCTWIMDESHWGGAIELSILSQYYGIEIVAVDTINLRLNRFGEDKAYDQRILLIYDGIHYDALKYEPADHRKPIITLFPTTEDRILSLALEVAKEANDSRQFTDVQNFKLKCLVCQKKLKGQIEAHAHAQETGHVNFGEVLDHPVTKYNKQKDMTRKNNTLT